MTAKMVLNDWFRLGRRLERHCVPCVRADALRTVIQGVMTAALVCGASLVSAQETCDGSQIRVGGSNYNAERIRVSSYASVKTEGTRPTSVGTDNRVRRQLDNDLRGQCQAQANRRGLYFESYDAGNMDKSAHAEGGKYVNRRTRYEYRMSATCVLRSHTSCRAPAATVGTISPPTSGGCVGFGLTGNCAPPAQIVPPNDIVLGQAGSSGSSGGFSLTGSTSTARMQALVGPINMRTRPGTSNGIVGQIPQGACVLASECSNVNGHYWCRLEYNGTSGYSARTVVHEGRTILLYKTGC